MNRFIRYCEGVMEAGWLMALISVPLFFNFRGESVESEKNHLIRSLALIIFAAWGAGWIGKLGVRSNGLKPSRLAPSAVFKTPIVLIAAIVAGTVVVSTFLSVSPRISFWGVVNRRVGSYTFLSCFAIFAAMISRIRSQEQIDRLITTGIISTIPVSLYAIGQAFAIEPIMRAGGPQTLRVGSTFAHAIYLGAYLIMLFPLTLGRVVLCYFARRRVNKVAFDKLLQAAVYSFIALLQLAAIFLTVSRGPFVGLITGFSVMFLMLAVYLRSRGLVLGTMGATLVLVIAFALLVRSVRPEEAPVAIDENQRFSEFVDPQVGSAGERAAAWRAAIQAARFHASFSTGDARPARFSAMRAALGYGPECVGFVSRLYSLRDFNSKLPDHILFDRFHNDFWDTLITTGVLGVTANITLACAIICAVFKWIGFIGTLRQRVTFWCSLLGCAIVGIAGMSVRFGAEFFGVGLKLGLASGVMLYLLLLSWRNTFSSERAGVSLDRAVVMTALLSGLIAHLIEISFSFTFETSLLYFWTFTAAVVVVGHVSPFREASHPLNEGTHPGISLQNGNGPKPDQANPTLKCGPASLNQNASLGQRVWNSWREEAAGGFLIAIVLTTLGFMLIQKTEAQSVSRLILDSLTRLPGNKNTFTWCLLLGMALTILMFAAIWTFEVCSKASRKNFLRSFVGTLVTAILVGLVSWLLMASNTVSSLSIASVNAANVSHFLQERIFILDLHYAFLAVILFSLAAFIIEPATPAQPSVHRWLLWLSAGLSLLLAFCAAAVVYSANMSRSKSGMMDKLSREEYFRRQDNWPTAVSVIESAIKAAPGVDTPYLWLGKVLIEQAVASENSNEQLRLFSKANDVLLAGNKLNPLDAAFRARRGNLFLKRALAERSLDKRQALARMAVEFYEKATALDPGNFNLWNNLAYVHLTILRSMDDAQRCLLRSIDLQPKGHPAYGLLGDVFFQKGFATKPQNERQTLLRFAVTNYQKAIALSAANPGATYRYTVGLGKAFFNLGDLSQAIAGYQRAAALSPPAERWRNEEILARLFSDVHKKSNSLEHLHRAIDLAPPEKNADLLKLKAQILSLP